MYSNTGMSIRCVDCCPAVVRLSSPLRWWRGAAIREIALYPAGTIGGGARTSDATGRRWKCGASVVRNQDCARSRQEAVAEHVYGPFLLVRGDHYATSGDVLTPLLPAPVLWGMGSRHLVLSAILLIRDSPSRGGCRTSATQRLRRRWTRRGRRLPRTSRSKTARW